MKQQEPGGPAPAGSISVPAGAGDVPAPAVTRRGKLASFGPLAFVAALLLGMLGGLGAFTFWYGDGMAYMSDDPAACVNCHVMREHYDAWQGSAHRHVAVCNDCHLSRHPIGKWIVKADNGFFHSLAFTLGGFAEPIRIKPRNSAVTQNACIACHGDFVHAMLPVRPGGDMLDCVHCHRDAGHAHRR